jgi:hypothetical protein
MLMVEEKALLSQVERILHSDEFRTSEVLRRLLRFLAEKSAAGEADQLKEYAVAIDGLGKNPSYDPRQNSAVRIQVGRLRQRLAEYYRTEGKADEFIIDLPKGRFKLTCEQRSTLEPAPTPVAFPAPPVVNLPDSISPKATPNSPRLLIWAGLAMVITIACAAYYWAHMTAGTTSSAGWTSELEELWRPFVDSKQPLILAIEDPLFVEMNSEPGSWWLN